MRTIGTALTVAAVSSVTTAAGIAIADPDPRAAIPAPITIETVVGRGTDTFVDNRRKGEGVGDSFITTGAKLSDPSTRSTVGSMDILGTIASRRSDFASITARLRGGTVQVNGVMRHGRTPTVLAVTGGTGDFENARGTFTLNERTQRATFSLLP
jgi:hypothetical protein